MNFRVMVIRDVNVLLNSDITEGTAIIFDDISLDDKTREEKIHFFDLENTSHVNVKFGYGTIPGGTPRIFTTNDLYNIIGEKNPCHAPEELIRRLLLVNIDKSLRIHVKRSVTTVTEEIEISNQEELSTK